MSTDKTRWPLPLNAWAVIHCGYPLINNSGGPIRAKEGPVAETNSREQPAACTLVVTTLNEAKNIERLLASIMEQSSPPSEVIIVDAGSSDDTRELISRFGKSQTAMNVRLYVEPGTIGHCRNLGIRLASFDRILSTDGDCALDQNFVELMCAYLDEYDIVGGVYEVLPQTRAEALFLEHDTVPWDKVVDLYVYPSMAVAFRRAIFLSIGGYDESLEAGEDLDLCLRLRRSGIFRFHLAKDARVRHFVGRDFRTLLKMAFRDTERNVSHGLAGLGTPYWKIIVASLLPPIFVLGFLIHEPWIAVLAVMVVAVYWLVRFVRTFRRCRNSRFAVSAVATELLARAFQVAGVYIGCAQRLVRAGRPLRHPPPKKLG